MIVATERPAARRSVLATNTAASFTVLGLSVATVGPALPWLAQRWAVPLDQTGILYTALFAASCVTVVLSGVLLERIGRKLILVAGLLFISLGLAVLALSNSLGVGMAAALSLGLGWGCLDVMLNVFVSDLFPDTRNSALNMMNLFFGLGALLGPLAIGAALALSWPPDLVLAVLGGWALLTAALYITLRFPPAPVHVATHTDPTAPRPGFRVLRDSYVFAMALIFFLYVGAEAGFGGWSASYGIQGAHLQADVAALIPATFWVLFTIGRLGAGVIGRYISGSYLVLGGSLLGAAGGVLVALASNVPAALFLGAAIIGLGFAPIFPTAFGLATERHPAAAGVVSSLVVLGGSLGGAVLPNIQGHLLSAGGVPLAAGSLSVLALVIAALQYMAHSRRRLSE